MPRRLLAFLCLILLALTMAAPGRADEFQLPGLESDSATWFDALTKRYPAGGTPQARRTAEQQAATALRAKDYTAAATALEQRVALGESTSQQLLDLAGAYLRRTPPDPAKALLAGWEAFTGAEQGPPEIAALLIIADALRALDRNAQAVQALQAVVQRAPDNATYRRLLADAQRATGVLVQRVQTEGEAEPPRACIAFTVPPARRPDFNAADWVRLDPPVPGAAITREDDQICVSGLPSGATTRVILRAGLPGEQGLALTKETVLAVALPNRHPRIAFDSRLFVLPRGQSPSVGLTTVNLSAVSLKLIRLTERNIIALLHENKLGDPLQALHHQFRRPRLGPRGVGRRRRYPEMGAQPRRPHRPAAARGAARVRPRPVRLAGHPRRRHEILGRGRGATGAAHRSAPTVWRGQDGLTVQVRAYSDASVRPGVRLALVARNNDVLAEAVTDAQGVARFAAPLLRGEGPMAPAVLQAFGPGDDFAALDLSVAAFDLSDRGVEGQPQPGPVDSYVWLDRGIYRPGETVQVMALLRSNAGLPADLPARVTVKRPNGQVFLQATPPREADAAIHLPVVLSAGAAVGTWTVEVQADPNAPPIGKAEFRVDAFIPDRMAVETGTAPAVIIPGQPAIVPVSARFLYGAPAANLSGTASMRLVVDPAPFPALAGYRIGLAGETYAPEASDLELPDTNAQGQTKLTILLARAPDTTQPLKAAIDITVNDPAGHGSRAALEIPVRSAFPLIGIKPAFPDNAVDAGSEAGFDIAAVRPDGQRTALKAKLRLVRERPDWRLVMNGNLARYETVWRDEPLETSQVDIPEGTPLHFARKLDFGRYRIEVAQEGGMAVSSTRFRAGWASSDSPDVPDRADVAADRRSVPAGQSVKIHIAPPFAGDATLLVLTDRVLSLRTLSVSTGGTDVDVPVETAWGPGAYVAVHVFRPGSDGSRPGRAIGLTWVGVDPAARTLAVTVPAPERLPPRAHSVVPVRTAPGAWVTLAAVDEGILRLTSFVSPNPVPHFLGRRGLGIDIRDDWGRLIAPPDGPATLLRQGGDEGSFVLPDIPLRTVVLFTPPVQAGTDGVASIPLDLPDFNGQVRLMAVSWLGSRIGAGSTDVTVRDPLVAEALLPRFLAPGDEARLAVLLHNLDLPAGEAVARISVQGPLAVSGADRLAVNLAPGAQAVPATVLRATGTGRGVIRLEASGPGGFAVSHDYALTVRPARGPVAQVAGGELAPGADIALAPVLARFLPGTAQASASFGAPVRYDAAALVQALARYPLACLEQATSRGLPLAVLPDGSLAGPDRAGRLQAQVASVLDRQRYRRRVFALVRQRRGRALADRLRHGVPAARPHGRRGGAGSGDRRWGQGAGRGGRSGPERAGGAGRAGVPPLRARLGRPRPARRGAGAGRNDGQAAHPAGEGATRGGAGAVARHAARRDGLRCRAGRAGPALVGGRLRHRAARRGGDRRAAEGIRPAGGSSARYCRRPAGRRPAGRCAQHPGTSLGLGRRRGAGPRRQAGAHRARRARPARSRGGDGGAGRSGDRPQSRRPGGLAKPRGHRHPGRGTAGRAQPDAGAAPLLQPRRLDAGPRHAEAEHRVCPAARRQGRGRAGPPRHADAGPAGGLGSRRPLRRGRRTGPALARRIVADRGADRRR